MNKSALKYPQELPNPSCDQINAAKCDNEIQANIAGISGKPSTGHRAHTTLEIVQ